MGQPLFTVFTPTYNRAYILPKLYESLKTQRIFNFDWMIVDDGSTDDTEALVNGWKQENPPFEIQYEKKENGGKPRAINYGVERARGKYFLIVDSDDYLTSDAIEKMTDWVAEIDEDSSFIGVGAASGFPDGSYIKGCPPRVNEQGYVDATNLERSLYDLDVDMTEAYKVEIFKQFPMAEWEGETFAPEQIAMNEMALAGYKLRWHKDIIRICEYFEDGLTKGASQLERKNPMGHAMMYNHKLKYPLPFKQKFKAACQHIALSIYGKHTEYIWKSNRLGITLLALPLGVVIAFRRKKQFNK